MGSEAAATASSVCGCILISGKILLLDGDDPRAGLIDSVTVGCTGDASTTVVVPDSGASKVAAMNTRPSRVTAATPAITNNPVFFMQSILFSSQPILAQGHGGLNQFRMIT